MDKSKSKTLELVRRVYGRAMEDAGLDNAADQIDQLLQSGDPFIKFIPALDIFEDFKKRFAFARMDVLRQMNWSYDKNKIKQEPVQDQSIKDYYETVFYPAVTEVEGNTSDAEES